MPAELKREEKPSPAQPDPSALDLVARYLAIVDKLLKEHSPNQASCADQLHPVYAIKVEALWLTLLEAQAEFKSPCYRT